MASGDIGSNPAVTKIRSIWGFPNSGKEEFWGRYSIKRSELNVKSAQDIVLGVNPTMEGSLSRIQTLKVISVRLAVPNQSTL